MKASESPSVIIDTVKAFEFKAYMLFNDVLTDLNLQKHSARHSGVSGAERVRCRGRDLYRMSVLKGLGRVTVWVDL